MSQYWLAPSLLRLLWYATVHHQTPVESCVGASPPVSPDPVPISMSLLGTHRANAAYGLQYTKRRRPSMPRHPTAHRGPNHLVRCGSCRQLRPAARMKICSGLFHLDLDAAALMHTHATRTFPYSRQRTQGKAGWHQAPHSLDTIRERGLIRTTNHQCIKHSESNLVNFCSS